MALSTCFSRAQIFSRNDTGCRILRNQNKLMLDARLPVSLLQCLSTRHLHAPREWSLGGGYRVAAAPDIGRLRLWRIRPGTCSCGMVGSQLASTAFTVGTAAVLPLYTLMIVAPRAEITKKAMDSSVPYVVLGLVYAYLLYLSWTPDTIRLMFTSKYWLPELPGIAKMFSSEMTLASAWIHLLVVDLFAARCIYHDGLESEVETRHSISLCLLVCPIGILTHTVTKALTGTRYGSSKHNTEM